MGDGVQQRLRIVNVGHAKGAGGGQQQHRVAGRRPSAAQGGSNSLSLIAYLNLVSLLNPMHLGAEVL